MDEKSVDTCPSNDGASNILSFVAGRTHGGAARKRGSLLTKIISAVLVLSVCAWVFPRDHLWRRCSRLRLGRDIVDVVLDDVPLIDGHNDWPFMLRYRFHNKIYNGSITINSTLAGQVDFPRLRAGRVGGQLWSVWVPCPGEFDSQGTSSTKESRFADDVYGKAIHDTLQQVDLVKRMIGEFPEALIAAGSAQDVWDNYALSKTRISSITGAEGLHSIGNSASILRTYHSIGVRYMTLTHACHNKYADSASEPPYWHGLSEDGKAIVTEMNRIGMMVDLAHTSADTMRQTLDHTDVPLIFSHSSSYTVCPHRRNVPDDVLWKLKKNNGIVMVTFLNDYVNCETPGNATIVEVADHIEYIGQLIGYEHLGIGSDFDGMLMAPKGLEDVSKYPALIRELASRDITISDLKGIVGGNLLRVLKDVEHAAQRLKYLKPLEDEVKPIKFMGKSQDTKAWM